MTPPVLIDASHTSHTQARTGIQRVTRSLVSRIPGAQAVTFDPFEDTWRSLDQDEEDTLTTDSASQSRGARWSLSAKLVGRVRRMSGARRAPPEGSVLVVPELFSPAVAAALPRLFAVVDGPKIALFHDAIALQQPWSAPAKTVARFPAYMKELLRFDGIAAISEDSKTTLLQYWRWLGVTDAPPVEAIGLGVDRPGSVSTTSAAAMPEVLFVSTLEGRKNHVALLDACEQLWSQKLAFTLRLIGLSHPDSGRPALDRLAALQAKGRPIVYDGAVPEGQLEAAYARCTFTAYPSTAEGFGLPVLESLIRGKPCLCSAQGAVGELATEGGCLAVPSLEPAALAAGLKRLLTEPGLLDRLRSEALARSYPTWDDYANSVVTWACSVRRRA